MFYPSRLAAWMNHTASHRFVVPGSVVSIILLYLAWQLQPANLQVFAYLYDEGVYLETALALSQGYDLYTDIFSSQPPLFSLVLSGLFTLFGPSVAVSRIVVILFSLGALAGVALVARLSGGWLAGLCAAGILAFSPDFTLEARTVAPEIPALALGCLAVGLGASASQRQPLRWLAVGFCLALALLTKFSAIVFLPAVAVLWLWPTLAGQRRSEFVRNGAMIAIPCLVIAGVALSQINQIEAIDQLVTFRTSAQKVYRLSIPHNAQMVAGLYRAQPHDLILAGLGLMILVWQRQWRLLVVLMGFLASCLIALLTYSPLFDHHLVLLLPPLAIAAGIGLSASLRVLVGTIPPAQSFRRYLGQALSLAVLALALVEAVPAAARLQHDLPNVAASWVEPAQAVAALRALPGGVDELLLDDQMVAFVAGKLVLPEMVDTSRVRISTGYLTLEDLITVIEKDDPDAIFFWSDRFRRIPGFRQWVRQHYRLYQSLGNGRELYLRRQDAAYVA